MERACPRCHTANPEVARFCRHCGLALVVGPDGLLGAGRLRHPDPLPPPDGCQPFENAPDLHFHCKAAWGGKLLLATEPLTITAFNAGYTLAEVAVRIRGTNDAGEEILVIEQRVAAWPRGGRVTLEIPSYELPAPARKLVVTLVSAEFGPDT
jgi:hypothetical protein